MLLRRYQCLVKVCLEAGNRSFQVLFRCDLLNLTLEYSIFGAKQAFRFFFLPFFSSTKFLFIHRGQWFLVLISMSSNKLVIICLFNFGVTVAFSSDSWFSSHNYVTEMLSGLITSLEMNHMFYAEFNGEWYMYSLFPCLLASGANPMQLLVVR